MGVDVAEIHFRPIPQTAVAELVADETTMWCAGGLMVEHPALAPYIESIQGGGMDSVMGLSTRLLASLLVELRFVQQHPQPPPPLVLAQRRWAVVGDVRNDAKPAAAVFRRLQQAGRVVEAVNPRDGSCASSLAESEGGVDAGNLIISPKLGVGFVDECWRLGIRFLFVQPGADAPAVLERAKARGLEGTTGCVLRIDLPPL